MEAFWFLMMFFIQVLNLKIRLANTFLSTLFLLSHLSFIYSFLLYNTTQEKLRRSDCEYLAHKTSGDYATADVCDKGLWKDVRPQSSKGTSPVGRMTFNATTIKSISARLIVAW